MEIRPPPRSAVALIAFLLAPPTSAFLPWAVGNLHYLLVSAPLPFLAPAAAPATNLASAWLPALLAVGMAITPDLPGIKGRSDIKPEDGPAPALIEAPVDFIVQLPQGRNITADVILKQIDVNQRGAVRVYRSAIDRKTSLIY